MRETRQASISPDIQGSGGFTHQVTALADEGYTVSVLVIDGQYIMTATCDATLRRAVCGIGTTVGGAMAMLQEHKGRDI